MSEFRSSIGASVGRISGDTFEHREVSYSRLYGLAIFEGDIMLGTVVQIQAMAAQAQALPIEPKGLVIKGEQCRCAGSQVPYRVDPALPRPSTCSRRSNTWRRRRPSAIALNGSNLNQYRDACTSRRRVGAGLRSVGRAASRRSRSVTAAPPVQRDSRDWPRDFDQYIRDDTDVDKYDYGSIMHYAQDTFSQNGEPAIVPKQAGVVIGPSLLQDLPTQRRRWYSPASSNARGKAPPKTSGGVYPSAGGAGAGPAR